MGGSVFSFKGGCYVTYRVSFPTAPTPTPTIVPPSQPTVVPVPTPTPAPATGDCLYMGNIGKIMQVPLLSYCPLSYRVCHGRVVVVHFAFRWQQTCVVGDLSARELAVAKTLNYLIRSRAARQCYPYARAFLCLDAFPRANSATDGLL